MSCETSAQADRDRTGSSNVVPQAFLLPLRYSFLSLRLGAVKLVSVTGFEPATLRFQGGYSTQTELHTVLVGAARFERATFGIKVRNSTN